MKEITDVYFPICQMIGLSTIKNDFGNATFKYYKPAMYQELSEALDSYMEERNSLPYNWFGENIHNITAIVGKMVLEKQI